MLRDEIAALANSRERAWTARADSFRVEAAQVERDPNAVGYNAAAAEATLGQAITAVLNGVDPQDRQRRIDDLRDRAARFAFYGAHVRDLAYAALVPFDPAHAALVLAHPAPNLVAGPAVVQAGGRAQIAKLTRLLTIAGGNWGRLAPLLAAAAGSAAEFDRYFTQIDTFARARAVVATTPPVPAGLPQPASIASQRVDYVAAFMRHFLQRHTYEWLNFAAINNVQGFWPVGTTPQQISDYLEEALQILHPPIWFAFARAALPPLPAMLPIAPFPIPSGFTVNVGIGWAPPPNVGRRVVGQFYPLAQANVVDLTAAELGVIRTVLGI
jgi:hypothetical protein